MIDSSKKPLARAEGFGTVARLFRKGELVLLTGEDGVVVGQLAIKSADKRGVRIAITMRRSIRIDRVGAEGGMVPQGGTRNG